MTFHSFNDQTHLYFVTASLCGWKQLFIEPNYMDIVMDSLVWLRKNKQMKLYAYVLMPSHLHVLIKPMGGSIGEWIQKFGSYTAHAILKQLRIEERQELLSFFHESRRDPRHQNSIWQDIQAKNIYSEAFLQQKMEYIHNNPVADKGWIFNNRADYEYSSARFYDRGKIPLIPVDDIRDFLGY